MQPDEPLPDLREAGRDLLSSLTAAAHKALDDLNRPGNPIQQLPRRLLRYAEQEFHRLRAKRKDVID